MSIWMNDLGFSEDMEIPTFLKRDGIKEKEDNYKNNIGNINKDITILGMDTLGMDVIKKIKHLGYNNIECILLSEHICHLNNIDSDGKMLINREKNISEYYEEIDYIVKNSNIIIQVMDLGSNISTSISDRINYQCKSNGKKIVYICLDALSFDAKSIVESAKKQKNLLKDEAIFIIDINDILTKYGTVVDNGAEEITRLAIEAVDYVIKESSKYYNPVNSTDIVVNANENKYNENSISIADELLKYKELLDSGLITREEFDRMKNNLIK